MFAANVLKHATLQTTICSANNLSAVPLTFSKNDDQFSVSPNALLHPLQVIIVVCEIPMILLCLNDFV